MNARQPLVISLLVSLGIGAGVTLGVLFAQPALPGSIPNSITPDHLAITTQDFADEQPVTLTVANLREGTLKAPSSGVVTDSVCPQQPHTLGSGSVPFSVDEQPVLALHTDTPLWRNLNYYDHGADVTALKAELTRLGYATSPGNQYLWLEANALATLRTGHSVTPDTSELDLTRTVWLPQAELTLTGCTLYPGDRTTADDTRFASTEARPNVTVNLGPATDGPARTVTVDGATLEFTPGTAQLTEASLSALIATESYASALWSREENAPFTLPAVSQLATPRTGALIPPSALTLSDDTRGCVGDDGSPLPVTVAHSRLGQTIVIFDADQSIPTTIDAESPASCG